MQARLGGAGAFHSEHQAVEGAIITVTELRAAMTKPVREMHSAARACLGRAIVLAAILLFGVVSLRAEPADRGVAEWVLRLGGWVVVDGGERRIHDVAGLPRGDFRIQTVNLAGARVDPPDLARFTPLVHLKDLHLPGPMWNPRAGSRTDQSRALHHIAPLRNLHRLTFSYIFLSRIRFSDSGLAATLEPFTNLRALDVTFCPFEDRSMKFIAGMKKLRKLLLRDTLADAGLEHVAALTDLEELDLHGTEISDAGLGYLKNLTRLRKLNLLGADVTDAGLEQLSGLRELEELNLYRTKITNAGLEKLKRFPRLRELDLRYTRATQAGVEDLRAALPDARLAFLDLAPSTSVSAESAPKLSGEGDLAVADWIRAMGGRAAVSNGMLEEVSLASTAVTDSQLENLHGLEHLKVLDLQATEVGDLGLEHLSGLSALRELTLSHTLTSDAGLHHLSSLESLRKLRLGYTLVEGSGLAALENRSGLEELSLIGSPVKDKGLAALAAMSSLTRLSLAYTDITDEGMSRVGALENLTRLDLSGADVGDEGLVYLRKLAGLKELSLSYGRFTDEGLANLEKLDMVRTRLTDAGLVKLAEIKTLTSLNLDYTSITDAGLPVLAGLSNLGELSLDSANVTDEGAQHLASMPLLRKLNLYHTFVTTEGHQKLGKALPNCEITWDPHSSLPTRRGS